MQGVAEVLPVSSSAQLTLLPWLLRWEPPADRTGFAAGLHAGSCAGLLLALHAELDPTAVRRTVLAAVPAAVAGALAQDAVEARLGRPGPTAVVLASAGAVLALADRSPSVRASTAADVRAAAVAQVAALVPGVSRSGATLTALRARSVRREDALRLSLLMSLPVTAGAAGLTAVRSRTAPPALPTLLAAGAAYVTARRVTGASPSFLSGSALYRGALAGAVGARLLQEKTP